MSIELSPSSRLILALCCCSMPFGAINATKLSYFSFVVYHCYYHYYLSLDPSYKESLKQVKKGKEVWTGFPSEGQSLVLFSNRLIEADRDRCWRDWPSSNCLCLNANPTKTLMMQLTSKPWVQSAATPANSSSPHWSLHLEKLLG